MKGSHRLLRRQATQKRWRVFILNQQNGKSLNPVNHHKKIKRKKKRYHIFNPLTWQNTLKKSYNRPYKDETTWAGSYIAGGECTAIIFLI